MMRRCQDCGNKAKKDCYYYRCRTCCRSRGFECETHVKSTWVPVSTRLPAGPSPPDLMILMNTSPPPPPHHDHYQQYHQQQYHHDLPAAAPTNYSASVLSTVHQQHLSNPCKRFRLLDSSTASGLREGHFPGEVTIPATFRCLKVSSSDETYSGVLDHHQYAYQTAVNIGGHVFKGVLYDQGPAADPHQDPNHYSSGRTALDQQPNLNIGTANSPSSNYPPPTTTPPPFNAFTLGTHFFPCAPKT